MVSVATLRVGRLGWPAEAARPGPQARTRPARLAEHAHVGPRSRPLTRRRGPHLAEAVWPETDLTRQILKESENSGLGDQVTMRYPVSGVDHSCLGAGPTASDRGDERCGGLINHLGVPGSHSSCHSPVRHHRNDGLLDRYTRQHDLWQVENVRDFCLSSAGVDAIGSLGRDCADGLRRVCRTKTAASAPSPNAKRYLHEQRSQPAGHRESTLAGSARAHLAWVSGTTRWTDTNPPGCLA